MADESKIMTYWAKREADRLAKYPDGNYPPLERWSLPLTIKRAIERSARRAARHARRTRS